jgi:hypothetical protein
MHDAAVLGGVERLEPVLEIEGREAHLGLCFGRRQLVLVEGEEVVVLVGVLEQVVERLRRCLVVDLADLKVCARVLDDGVEREFLRDVGERLRRGLRELPADDAECDHPVLEEVDVLVLELVALREHADVDGLKAAALLDPAIAPGVGLLGVEAEHDAVYVGERLVEQDDGCRPEGLLGVNVVHAVGLGVRDDGRSVGRVFGHRGLLCRLCSVPPAAGSAGVCFVGSKVPRRVRRAPHRPSTHRSRTERRQSSREPSLGCLNSRACTRL